MKNNMIKYPLILGTIALVAGLLLAFVYNITAPIIEENKVKRENAIVIELFGDDAKIEDFSETLTDTETSLGIYSVLKVTDNGKKYYVYKVTFADSYDGDQSSYVLTLTSAAKIHDLTFISYGDNYASGYASDEYSEDVKGKGSLSINVDKVAGATATGKSFVSSVNAAIKHQGGIK